MQITIPKEARDVLLRLESAGYEAYIVGGTVRDLILSSQNDKYERPLDVDIATSAVPKEIDRVFDKYKKLYVGARHGTITIRYKGRMFDITTFRTEGAYSDGRRPDYVRFITSLEEDLSRRDLTINAIACDKEGYLVDPFNGVQDIKNRIIRTVGRPEERFEEDALRLLRTLRFAVKLDFEIEENTFFELKNHARKIIEKKVSLERIFVELQKIFTNNAVRGIDLLIQSDLVKFILPEVYEGLQSISPENERMFLVNLFREVDDNNLYWSLLIYPASVLKNGRKYVQRVLSRLKGMKKDIRMFTENIIEMVKNTRHILLQEVSRGEIELWIVESRWKYRNNHNEFWRKTPEALLKITSGILKVEGEQVVEEKIEKIREDIHRFDKEMEELPTYFDGNLAKELGARGRSIRDIIQLWTNQRLRYREGMKRDDYISFCRSLADVRQVDVEEYLRAVSRGQFRNGIHETKHVRRELRALDRLLSNFGGMWYLVNVPGNWEEIVGGEKWNNLKLLNQKSEEYIKIRL